MERVASHNTIQRTMSVFTWVAFILLVVGGINWGLVGLFGFDLVATLFGHMAALSRVIYTLVGISAVYCLFAMPGVRRRTPSATP